MRTAYIDSIYELTAKDENVYALISDNGAIVYDKFKQDFPKHLINVGISEANMVGMAAGMARRGKIPFAYTIGAFLAYRAYEFIINDVCWQQQNVKLVGIGAGCAYSLLGSSHHTIFDLAALRPLPNLTIFSPASPLEVKKVVQAAYNINGPVYIRLGTNREVELYSKDYKFMVGKAVTLRNGTDIAIMGTGSILADVMEAAKALNKEGISVRVINFPTIKPVDKETILDTAKTIGKIVIVEEHSNIGGFGDAVTTVLAEKGQQCAIKCLGFTDFVHGYGKHGELKANNGLSIADIVKVTKKMVKGEV